MLTFGAEHTSKVFKIGGIDMLEENFIPYVKSQDELVITDETDDLYSMETET